MDRRDFLKKAGLAGGLSAAGALTLKKEYVKPVVRMLEPSYAEAVTPIPEVRLGLEDRDRLIMLNIGQDLVISLEGNPTTGYTWEVAAVDESILRQVGEVEFEPESDLVGAPGEMILRFQAIDSGRTELALVYWRPWEKEAVETYSITVNVV